MIGIYLLEKTQSKISIDQKIKDPNFLPVNVITEEFSLSPVENGWFIMPTTYQVCHPVWLIAV